MTLSTTNNPDILHLIPEGLALALSYRNEQFFLYNFNSCWIELSLTDEQRELARVSCAPLYQAISRVLNTNSC